MTIAAAMSGLATWFAKGEVRTDASIPTDYSGRGGGCGGWRRICCEKHGGGSAATNRRVPPGAGDRAAGRPCPVRRRSDGKPA
ncbi:hypothetical protein MESS4_80013 [Mesorhizobium sp. STM 4661]|nr:hypothetical protein MESS4_80013 [Mesorhizobium sp. STM 4661]